MGVEIAYEGSSWRVYTNGTQAVLVPHWTVEHTDVEDGTEAARQTIPPNWDVPDGAARLAGGNHRDAAERAHLFGIVDAATDLDEPLDYPTAEGKEPPRKPVPAAVAGNGPEYIAGYLASQDCSNREIAEILDVQARTVSQYISDLKSGR